jgi:hypothetical protein
MTGDHLPEPRRCRHIGLASDCHRKGNCRTWILLSGDLNLGTESTKGFT